ncbi:murein hydrolase activator EnvC family protein [Lysobacter hankyongensis]|uniref:Peptidoglycan DD-metalloendopeptidase family protein n=1 Tax=Lysobacter hankyongensis TaxID=1176535 RepID=A0ABP9C4V2_9GAMM
MRHALRPLCALALLALLLLPQAGAQQAGVQQAGKPAASPDAQRRLEKVQRELKDVAAERRRLEGQRGAASRELRAVDERVASSSRALYEAERQLAREQTALAELGARREDLLRQQAGQRRELAALLRAAHAQGDQGPLKLMLAQDRVADAQRQLVYYRYLQRQRLQRTAALSAELAELERVEAQIAAKRTALDAARERQQAQLAALARDRRSRAATLGELEQRYRDRQAREQALGSDAKALQQLVARLRAAAAKAAAERAAAERAAAQRDARNAAARAAKPTAPRPGERATPRPPRQTANAAPVRVGGFGWPLSGNLLAGYGGRMPDGRASHGLLIAAGLGTPVRAVADGNVVFAEWMTGYGLILIVDHGNGYLSLYAHNESLLKDVGAAVKRGDAVARVGNSGGLAQPALYFELRRNGQPVDPGSWLRRQ